MEQILEQVSDAVLIHEATVLSYANAMALRLFEVGSLADLLSLYQTSEFQSRCMFFSSDGHRLSSHEYPFHVGFEGILRFRQRNAADFRWIVVRVIPQAGHTPPRTVTLLRDFTSEKQASHLIQAIYESSDDGIFFKDLDGTYRFINSAGARIMGRPREEIEGASDETLAAPNLRAGLAAEDQRVLTERTPSSRENCSHGENGRPVYHLSVKRPYVDADGRTAGLIGVIKDITERKRSEEIAFFFAEAGRILGSSLDWRSTLKSLSWLAIPSLADWCVIDLLEADGEFKRTFIAHDDPKMVALSWEFYEADPKALHSQMAGRVLRTGKSELISRIKPQDYQERNQKILRQVQCISTLCVPLRVHGNTLGTLTLAMSESGRHFDAEDLVLAEELALRASFAVSHGRVYEQAVRNGGDSRLRQDSENFPDDRLSIDPITFTVSREASRSPALTSKEFQILNLLHSAGAQGLTRGALLKGIWGDLKISANSLDVHLFNLRKKISPLDLEVPFRSPNIYFLNAKRSVSTH